MTNQERDRFIYNNDRFGIVKIDGEGLFNPADCGIKVIPISTACWRGYYCCYGIIDNSLCLHEVYLGLDQEDERLIQKGNGVQLFGKTPRRYKYFSNKLVKVNGKLKRSQTKEEFESWDFRCNDLNQLIEFTGGMLIGSDNLARVNLLPQSCSNIYELVFDSGQLIEAINRSSIMSEFRDMLRNEDSILNTRKRSREAEQWLKKCFSWDYDL